MQKTIDWAEQISDNIANMVRAYLDAAGFGEDNTTREAVENALELVLSQSCAGPKSIALARQKLGIAQ